MSKSVLFRNWSNEDFTWTWDGTPFSFPAGREMYLQDYLADHFAKHLTDREMLKDGIELNYRTRPERLTYIEKCFVKDSAFDANSDALAEFENLNRNADIEVASPKRMGRPPKAQGTLANVE